MNSQFSSNLNKGQKNFYIPRSILFILAFVLMLFMSGCGVLFGSDPEPTPEPILGTASEQPLTGIGYLTCNQTCADQAQCGTAEGFGPVVLLNSAGPSLDSHTLIVGTNFEAEIREHMNVEVRRNGDEISQFMRFYKVSVRDETADRGEAWVAGWCIQQ